MINLYSIIVGLFSLAGAALALWSWRGISQKRRTSNWEALEARIIAAVKQSPENDMLPLVTYQYEIDNQKYQGVVDVPSGESALPEFADQFLKKYPLDSQLTVYCNPQNPAESALKKGVNSEDWVIFSVGIGACIFGAGYFIANI